MRAAVGRSDIRGDVSTRGGGRQRQWGRCAERDRDRPPARRWSRCLRDRRRQRHASGTSEHPQRAASGRRPRRRSRSRLTDGASRPQHSAAARLTFTPAQRVRASSRAARRRLVDEHGTGTRSAMETTYEWTDALGADANAHERSATWRALRLPAHGRAADASARCGGRTPRTSSSSSACSEQCPDSELRRAPDGRLTAPDGRRRAAQVRPYEPSSPPNIGHDDGPAMRVEFAHDAAPDQQRAAPPTPAPRPRRSRRLPVGIRAARGSSQRRLRESGAHSAMPDGVHASATRCAP